MIRRLLFALGLLLLPQLAWAGTCPNTLSMKDGGGSTVTLAENTDGTNLAPCVSQIGSTPTTATMQSAAVANGNGTVLGTAGMATATLTVNCATCSGGTTVNFEGTQDGTNYTPLNAQQLGTTGSGSIASSTTAAGFTYWEVSTPNLTNVRARISAYSAGTVTVTGTATPMPASPRNVMVAGGAVTANAGTNLNTSALALDTSVGTTNTNLGAPGATACSTDTGSCSLNQLMQRLAQRLTTVNTTLGSPFQTGGALASHQSTNVDQFGGSSVVTGTGAGGSGIPRVTISNDSSLAANQSVNVNQIGGASVSTAASGTQKVGVVGNAGATLDGTTAAGTAPTNGIPALGVYNSTVPAPTNGQSVALQVDANGGLRHALTSCPNTINIAQTASTDVHTFTHFGYICTIMLVSATAQSIGIREGTGTTCATSPTSLIGDSSGTAEVALAANGGFSLPMGSAPMRLATSADHLCVEQSSTGEVAGTITYADLAN